MLFIKSKREISLHLMLVPAVILTLVFSYGPMVGLIMAFQDFNPGLGIFKSPWVGLKNFSYIINLPGIFQVVWNTIYIAFFKIIGGIVVPVTFALLLNEMKSVRFKRISQTIIYLPNFISWIILAGIFVDMFSPSEGIVNKILGIFGIQPIFFMGDKFWFPIVMIITDVWKGFGFGTIIYLAALTGIDPALYESSVIDGAGRWKQTLYITLPGILPIIILLSVLSIGNILSAGFDQIFNMYNPSVYETGDIIDTFVYRLGIDQALYSAATAVGMLRSVVSFVLVTLSWLLADKVANYRVI